jgi:hypothetical protein
MRSHGDRILQILRKAKRCLTAKEIAMKLDEELGGFSYAATLVASVALALPEVYESGGKYCLKKKREGVNQATLRVVRQSTSEPTKTKMAKGKPLERRKSTGHPKHRERKPSRFDRA